MFNTLYNATIQFLPEFITAIISIGVSFIFYLRKSSRERDFFIKSGLDSILKIAIEYPYLEDTEFLKDWSNKEKHTNDEITRYELYATLVFNYLERLFILFNGKEKKIKAFIDVKDWAESHRLYWNDPNLAYENYSGYNTDFQNYINKFLNIRK